MSSGSGLLRWIEATIAKSAAPDSVLSCLCGDGDSLGAMLWRASLFRKVTYCHRVAPCNPVCDVVEVSLIGGLAQWVARSNVE